MEKVLYLMRHAETLFNRRRKIQGWCDAPLTEFGQYQASCAREYFKREDIAFSDAYSSTSERACDTLEIVTNGEIPYQRMKGLKEWNFGTFEGESEDLNPPLPYEDFFVPYGGESQNQVVTRMVTTITKLMQESKGSSILIVSHGGAIANFARAYREYWQTDLPLGLGNCAILKFHFRDDVFYLEEVIRHDFSGWKET